MLHPATARISQDFIVAVGVHGNKRTGYYMGMINSADGADSGIESVHGSPGKEDFYAETPCLMGYFLVI
jgi:hypothetical protein